MCNQTEHWAVFPEDPRYSVSDLGNVKNNKTGRITKGRIQCSKSLPYYRFKLGKYGKTVGVHYMVLVSFVPKPGDDYMCDHINRNSLDNRLENLRWVSCLSNNMNSSHRTIYGFLNNEYIGTFIGWEKVAEYTGFNVHYLRKRCNGNDPRYASKTIKGYLFTTEKKYREQTGWKRFVMPICD